MPVLVKNVSVNVNLANRRINGGKSKKRLPPGWFDKSLLVKSTSNYRHYRKLSCGSLSIIYNKYVQSVTRFKKIYGTYVEI